MSFLREGFNESLHSMSSFMPEKPLESVVEDLQSQIELMVKGIAQQKSLDKKKL